MPTIDPKTSELKLRIVYHGPGLAGKTTNLEYVFERTAHEKKTKLASIAIVESRALAFDFLPQTIAPVDGHVVRIELITGPGPLYRDPVRRLILVGADAVVFVADSQVERSEANAESMEELLGYLEAHGTSITETPLVIQYNKRDLPNAMAVAELSQRINPYRVPEFEATARTGAGVFDTLKAVVGAMMAQVTRRQMPQDGRTPIYRD